MTQCTQILEVLREGKEITPRDAMRFNCYRLAARISDLKERGHEIINVGGKHGVYKLIPPSKKKRRKITLAKFLTEIEHPLKDKILARDQMELF